MSDKLTKTQRKVLQALADGAHITESWFPFGRVKKDGIVLFSVRCAVLEKLQVAGLVEFDGYGSPAIRLTENGKRAAA